MTAKAMTWTNQENLDLYVKALRENGIRAIHVQTKAQVPEFLKGSFDAEAYDRNVVYNKNNPFETVADLCGETPFAVFNGTESSVAVGDFLAASLGIAGNSTTLSAARTNKFLMHEALKAAGLNAMDHILTDSFEEMALWITRWNRWPVVLKPAASAGTDNVIFCNDLAEARMAFDRIFGSNSLFEQRNAQVLAQGYLDGAEYMINGVVGHGQVRFTDIWRYYKYRVKGASLMYDYCRLLSAGGEIQRQLTEYVAACLDALDIHHGSFHAEVMITAKGPVLVEVGARPVGACIPALVDVATGLGQIRLEVQAKLDPGAFLRSFGSSYSIVENSQIVFLRSQESGRCTGLPICDLLDNASEVHDYHMHLEVGEWLQETVDIPTSPGVVFLLHPDEARLVNALGKIREAELDGAYQTFESPVGYRSESIAVSS